MIAPVYDFIYQLDEGLQGSSMGLNKTRRGYVSPRGGQAGRIIDRYALEEVDRIRWKTVRALRRVLGKGVRQGAESVGGYRVRDDQHSGVWLQRVERVKRQDDEVVTVSRHETASLSRSPVQLFGIGTSSGVDIVGALGVDPLRPQQIGDDGAQILVEVIPQRQRATSPGYLCARRDRVQPALRSVSRSISSGYAA